MLASKVFTTAKKLLTVGFDQMITKTFRSSHSHALMILGELSKSKK